MTTDPVALTQALIRCPSVTPADAGALGVLEAVLSAAGFTCTRVPRGGIENLFARWGEQTNAPVLGFNGHTDVVPVGDESAWRFPPFGAEIVDGTLYGRGACDMKSGVAAFAAAAIDFVKESPPNGAIVLAITGDEEGDALDGTRALLDWMADNGARMDACIVGEPTCPNVMGEMIKIGRRGSLTAQITATGRQGHAAYPHRALNPLPALIRYLDTLNARELDSGTAHFDPSTLAVTTIDVGNPANNVIPAQGRATVNIRFNDAHESETLSAWLRGEAERISTETGVQMEVSIRVSGESFVTPPGALSDLVSNAVEAETGRVPELSTSGGTSDARFVKDHCPVVEVGLVGQSMHQVDEQVAVEHIHQLKAIYTRILRNYFAGE
ncbi:MAG: succinyl-diaminopimelate desuccinylase [Pseudomonadota bacterium]